MIQEWLALPETVFFLRWWWVLVPTVLAIYGTLFALDHIQTRKRPRGKA